MGLIEHYIVKMKHSIFKWLIGKGYDVAITPTAKVEEKTESEMIESIMVNFDFGKVHRAMVALNWKWLIDSELEIPSISQIKSNARKQLINVIKYAKSNSDKIEHPSIPVMYGTGGLKAVAFLSKDKSRVDDLRLYFIVSEWDALSE